MKESSPREEPEKPGLDLSDRDIAAFIDSQILNYLGQRDRALGEGNETERALCGQLMLVTTVMISANIVVLSNGELLAHLSVIQKLLSVSGVGLLVLSFILGIRYYFVIIHFHGQWAKANNKVANIFGKVAFKNFTEAKVIVDGELQPLPTEASTTALVWQLCLVVAALVVYLLLLVAIFFDFHGIG